MTAPMEAYTYNTLAQVDFFRYLVLQPGHGNEPLQCSLHTSLLDEAPYFEAVSYVWGHPERECPLVCDGKMMKITTSLRDVLRRVRLPTSTRYLWADSICIDQDNLEEKGHQVSLMARIYSRTNRTLMFIGLDDGGHAQKLVTFLDDVNDMIEDTFKRIRKTWEWDSYPLLEKDNFIFTDLRLASLNKLFDQEWFTRGWIVQESALAQDGLLIWGHHTTTWMKLMRTTSLLWTRVPQHMFLDTVLPHIHWLAYRLRHEYEARVFWAKGDQPISSLLSIINRGRGLQLTNPHDRIYAFMKFPTNTEEGDLKLEISYQRSYLDTFKEFAQAYIRSNANLDLLHYVVHSEESLTADFPSWVPQWDLQADVVGSHIGRLDWPVLKPRDSSIEVPILFDDATIGTRGVLFDSIAFASPIFYQKGVTIDDVAALWQQVSAGDISPYPPFRRLHAFVQALTGGIFRGDFNAWTKHEAAYLKYISGRYGGVSEADNQYLELTAKDGSKDVHHMYMAGSLHFQRFIVTKRGYVGIAPHTTREGDECAIIFGAKIPSILRRMDDTALYQFVGGSYIIGKHESIDSVGQGYFTLFGGDKSKDWVEWDIEEEELVLC